jgi:acyl carrier protein
MESAPNPLPTVLPGAAPDQLRHMPEAVRIAYERFVAGGNRADLDTVTVAILQDFRHKGTPPADYAPHLRLIEDLGFDSLAIAEIVFYAEDLFHITISNDEIVQVRTVGELCRFVGRKVGLASAS